MGSRFEMPIFQGFDSNGDPLSGGLLYSYIAGSVGTAKALYYDKTLATEASNPVILNSYGYAQNSTAVTTGLYGSGTYKLVLKNSAGVQQWSLDYVSGIGGGEDGLYVSDYGCDLAAAVTAIGADEVTLTIDCDVAVAADLVCPATLNLRWLRGQLVTVASSKTLTINNMTDPGAFQLFAGAGTVLFATANHVRPEWWDDDVHKAAYSLKDVGGQVDLVKEEYELTAHAITETTLASSAGVHLWSNVVLVGHSPGGCSLKLAAAQDCDCVRTWNYVDLTGQNAWYVDTEAVPYGFGLRNVRIDGNKANNASGSGVQFYGKGYITDRLIIVDANDYGFYSECGATVGQHDWRDMPESYLGSISIKSAGSDGFLMRGPHDYTIDRLFVANSGGYGIHTDYSAGVYSGGGTIKYCHTYGNTSGNLFNAKTHLVAGTFEDILVINESGPTSNTFNMQISQIKLFGSQAGTYFTSAAKDLLIGHLDMTVSGAANNGVLITGENTKIGCIQIDGNGSTGTGLSIQGDRVEIGQAHVNYFNGVGGLGLQLGDTGVGEELNGTSIGAIYLGHNETHFNYAKQGYGNKINVYCSLISATETFLHGSSVIPNSLGGDDFNIMVNSDATDVRTRVYRVAIDLPIGSGDSTGLKKYTDVGYESLRIIHGLIWTPTYRDVQMALYSPGHQDFQAIPIFYDADATYIYVALNIMDLSATAAAVCTLTVWARN